MIFPIGGEAFFKILSVLTRSTWRVAEIFTDLDISYAKKVS